MTQQTTLAIDEMHRRLRRENDSYPCECDSMGVETLTLWRIEEGPVT